MRSVGRVGASVATAVVLAAGLAAPATAETQQPVSHPSMRVFFGTGDTGDTRMQAPWPEYRITRYDGPLILFTYVNTGDVPLDISGQAGCEYESAVPVGGRQTCGTYVVAPQGAPDTTQDAPFPVTATAGGSPLTSDLTIEYHFYDALPYALLDLSAEKAGDAVRFHVEKYPPMPWVTRLPDVLSLTSSSFGDLLDPNNPLVHDNTCPATAGLQPCEFTATPTGASGSTVTETVSMLLSDGTGPTNTMDASVTVEAAGPAGVTSPTATTTVSPTPTIPVTASPTPTTTSIDPGASTTTAPSPTPTATVAPAPSPTTASPTPAVSTTVPWTPLPTTAPTTPTAPATTPTVPATSPTTSVVPGLPAPTTSTPTPAPTEPATKTPGAGRSAKAWAARSTPWPRMRVDGIQVGRRTSTRALFSIPRRCARVVPARLDSLLTSTPRSGACAQPWRLAKAATVAMLNEKVGGRSFPAKSPQDVVTRTDRTLRRNSAPAMAKLARTFERWNKG